MAQPFSPARRSGYRHDRTRLAGLAAAVASLMAIGADGVAAQSNRAEVEAFVSRTQLRIDQIMFIVRSTHPNIVDVEFYSQHRNVAWPGNDRVYSIDDYNWHTYILNCRPGEKICYGAGVRNDYDKYWGVGINDRHGCSNCCYTCEGAVSRWITLKP